VFIVQKLTTFNRKRTFKMDSIRKYKLWFCSLFLKPSKQQNHHFSGY